MNDWFSSLQANFGIKKLKGIEIQTILFFITTAKYNICFPNFSTILFGIQPYHLKCSLANATLKVSTLNQMPYLFG